MLLSASTLETLQFDRVSQVCSVRARRTFDRPIRIGAGWMVHEEVPRAVLAFAMDLHAVMMDLDRLAGFVLPRNQPLRACHREIAGNRHMMRDDRSEERRVGKESRTGL